MWLVEHAAFVYSIRKRHDGDGLKSYQRIKGREFSTRLLEFRESCHFRVNDDGASGGYKVRQGVFLVFDKLNGRYIVHPGDSVHVVRTVTRLPDSATWDTVRVQAVRCTPWSGHVNREDAVVFSENLADGDLQSRGRDPLQQARRAPIYQADLVEFGYTIFGCKQCEHMLRYGDTISGGSHSDACRRRIYARLSETAAGQERLKRADTRIGRKLEEHAERQGEPSANGEVGDVLPDDPLFEPFQELESAFAEPTVVKEPEVVDVPVEAPPVVSGQAATPNGSVSGKLRPKSSRFIS